MVSLREWPLQFQFSPLSLHFYHYHGSKTIHLMAFFLGQARVSWHQKGKPFWIFMKQEMMGWLAIASAGPYANNLHLTPNHASTSLLSFYRLDALPAIQPTVSKHWRQNIGLGLDNALLLGSWLYWCSYSVRLQVLFYSLDLSGSDAVWIWWRAYQLIVLLFVCRA